VRLEGAGLTTDAGVTGEPRTLADPLEESLRVVEVADRRGLTLRLMGGMAVRAHAPRWPARSRRVEVDLDFATTSKDRAAVYNLLAEEGYTPDKQQNALFGRKQAYFVDVPRKRPVDVLVDTLEMCHRLDFGDRLAMSRPTLPLADLLLSKLQVVKINRKDVLDALILLAEHPLAEDDGAVEPPHAHEPPHGPGSINVRRIVEITSNDWGWWRTVTGNLGKLDQYLATELQPEDLDLGTGEAVHYDASSQIAALREAIEATPKSTRWKLRARVGDRVTWYAEPEEMEHGVL
jgi:hypothetical protein